MGIVSEVEGLEGFEGFEGFGLRVEANRIYVGSLYIPESL